MKKNAKKLTVKQALTKTRSLCAAQERSHKEIRDKLYNWGFFSSEVETIITQLIEEGFLNEQRFAQLYSGGKFRIKKWGRNKIINGLNKHQISSFCIKNGLQEIDDLAYSKTIIELIKKKTKKTTGTFTFEEKGKIVRYLIQKGFESELAWQNVNSYFNQN